MKDEKVPETDHVLRFVPWGRLHRADDDETVIGVLPHAFKLKDDEDYLSVTWIEFFSGPYCDRLVAAVRAFRLGYKAGSKSRFVMGNVGKVHEACAGCKNKVRILHDPDPPNDAHVAVRRYPRDNQDLMELLVGEVFTAHIDNRAVPE